MRYGERGGSSFFAWAAEHWPAPRWSVELDPAARDNERR
jgi:hypothetical protein